MEQVNIGLGEAIAEGTNASGNWGSPINQGIALGQRNILLEAQKEEKKRAKQLALQEKMSKYSNFDSSKWYDKGIAKKANEDINTTIPTLFEYVKAGDDMGRLKTEQELSNRIAMYKIQDAEKKTIGTLKPTTTAIADNLKKVYNEKGYEGLVEDADLYPFGRLADVEDGSIRPRIVRNYPLEKTIKRVQADIEGSLPKLTQVGAGGGMKATSIDIKSPDFQRLRNKAILDIASDISAQDYIFTTPEFKKFYDDQLVKRGILRDEALQEGLHEDFLVDYIAEKFDKSFLPKVSTTKQTRSGGASGESKFTFTPQAGGYKVDYKGKSGVIERLQGTVLGENDEKKQANIDVIEPVLLYNPSNKTFTVKGLKKNPYFQGQYEETEVMDVPASTIMSKFDLKESDLISKFGAQGYGKGAAKPKGQSKFVSRSGKPLSTGK